MADGLLDGVRVLDLSIWRPGPYATQLLAELGAEVIKVEPPGGDPMRAYAELFAGLHADKAGLVLDLKDEADRARALALAAEADVVVEGYRPGVADRLGVGYEQVRVLNPSIIYCSVSGLGQDGPLSAVPGHDLNYGAWAGVLAPAGGPPVVPAVPVADLAGGLAAAFAISAALVRRQADGEGERIDVALASVLATWTGVAEARTEGVEPTIRGVPGYGTFATAGGGYLALGVVTEDHFWAPLCTQLGLDDVAGLGFGDRRARLDELQARLAGAIAGRPRDELVDQLLAAGVPVAPVLDRREMSQLDHFRAVGAVRSRPLGGSGRRLPGAAQPPPGPASAPAPGPRPGSRGHLGTSALAARAGGGRRRHRGGRDRDRGGGRRGRERSSSGGGGAAHAGPLHEPLVSGGDVADDLVDVLDVDAAVAVAARVVVGGVGVAGQVLARRGPGGGTGSPVRAGWLVGRGRQPRRQGLVGSLGHGRIQDADPGAPHVLG